MNPKITLIALLAGLLAMSNAQAQPYQAALAPFYHGVASGDPMSDRVILWTRITPPTGSNPDSIGVCWQVATDTTFQNIVREDNAYAQAAHDYTLHIDADGLQAATYYYYRFSAYDKYSLTGRTKTTPIGATNNVRLAIVSCANYSGGYFLAYERLVNRNDVDAIIYLGDYIYEYSSSSILGGVRPHEPNLEITTLADYRIRHSQYKRDPDLMRLHQNFPFISVWDDHETCNDSWSGGAQNHDTATEGPWATRKANGIQAYLEWQPIRQPEPVSDPQRIFRKINYGDLADIFMLDTRLYGREQQSGTTGSTVTNPNRTLLGANQYTWLTQQLSNSTAQWKIIGQQVMMAPMELLGIAVNGDQWDGYPAERQRLYSHIMSNNIQNIVVVTGDIHSSWANDLPYNSSYNEDTGAGSVGVEMVTPSVTTANFPFPIGENLLQLSNDHVKYLNLTDHGFILLDLNPSRAQGDWYHTPEPTSANYTASLAASYYVNAGERHLRTASAASPDVPHAILAPTAPQSIDREFELRVMLQGSYVAARNEMRTNLLLNNLLPTTQPFNTAPWYYVGTEQINAPADLPDSVTDWVLVELRDAADTSLLAQKAGLLHADGLITDTDGVRNGIEFALTQPCKSYRIAVRPRNHLAVLTAQTVWPQNPLYDFTTAQTQAAGIEQQVLSNGLYMLYAGDVFADGVINYTDYNSYAANTWQTNTYNTADLTMEGNVNNTDFTKYRPNARQMSINLLRY